MSTKWICPLCDVVDDPSRHQPGDCIYHLKKRCDRFKGELIDALWEIRGHSEYQFEKHYGALAVELGVEHTFVYFPPQPIEEET